MTVKEFEAEIVRLHKLLAAATREARRRDRLMDKLTAAQLRVDLLVKKFKEGV